jgi:hypothetical protein
MSSTGEHPFASRSCVTFACEDHAQIAKAALEADREVSAERILKTYAVEGSQLHVEIRASEARWLRVGLSGLHDSLAVVIRTLAEFAEDEHR